MRTLEKRLDVLEREAILSMSQNLTDIGCRSIEELRRKFGEVLKRKEPERTQQEQIERFRASLTRMSSRPSTRAES